MIIIEKIKKWIAGLTAVLMVSILFAPQAAFAGAPIATAPVPSVGTGFYAVSQSVSLTVGAEPMVCTYYSVDGGTLTRYAGVPIVIDAADGKTVTLDAKSFLPKTDCTSTENNGGELSMATQSYTFDKINPTATITSPADEALVTGFVDIKGTVNDLNLKQYSVAVYDSADNLVGGTGNIPETTSFANHSLPIIWNADTTDEGVYQIKLIAEDEAGNESNDALAVYVDRTAPNIPVHLFPEKESFKNNLNLVKFIWTAVTDLNGPVEYRLQYSDKTDVDVKGAFTSTPTTTGWSVTPEYLNPGLVEGVYHWHVQARDKFKLESAWSLSWKVTIDNSAPVINKIYDVADSGKIDVLGKIVNISKATTFAADVMDFWDGAENPDGINKYEWSSNDSENVKLETPNSSETKISTVKKETYIISLKAYDKAGNVSEIKSFTIVSEMEIAPVVLTPVLVAGASINTSNYYGNSSETIQEEKEVKSDDTEIKEEEPEPETKTLPYFGIVVLVLLGLVGLYLLYLQNPSWFTGLMFWKKRK